MQLGMNLEIGCSLLDAIEKDYPHDTERCCSKSKWLHLTPNTSWQMLCNAIQNIQSKPNEMLCTVENLNTVADELSDRRKKMLTAVDNMSSIMEKLKAVEHQLKVAKLNLSMSIGMLDIQVLQKM